MTQNHLGAFRNYLAESIATASVPRYLAIWRKVSAKLHWLKLYYFLVPIIGVGLFVRLYNRPPIEYYPDIMSILAAEALVHGQGYPFGYIGPPGPAIFFAPFALSFGVIDYAQIIIALFGALLAGLGYAVCKTLLKDEVAGLLASLMIAIDPYFVYISRVLWIDSINSFLVISSLLLFPFILKKNRLALFASYNGVLLLTLLFKTYNALILPALLVWAVLEWKSRILVALRSLLLSTGPAIAGLAAYIYSSPVEVYRISTGARGSVAPIIGLKIDVLSETVKSLTSFMYSPPFPSAISELSGLGYVNDALSLELGLIFLPFIIFGAWIVWRDGQQKKLLTSILVLVALTIIIFTSFGGLHPRHLMTSRLLLISLFSLGATRLMRGIQI